MNADLSDTIKPGPIAWMASNPIAANLLMVILLAGGLYMAYAVKKEVFPAYEMDIIDIRVAYPGSSPAEVEQGILQPIEDAVRSVKGIQELSASAGEGSGSVSIELVSGTDRMKAFQEVDQAVNRIRTFPIDAEDPEVSIRARQQEVMDIGLYGEIDVWSLRQLIEQLRDRLL